MPPVTLISNPININGAVTAYSTQVVSNSTAPASCPDNRTVHVSITNAGLGSINSTDSVFVAMPLYYGYGGNFSGIHNPPPVGSPFIQNFAGGSRLGWALPVGISPGDSVVFDFDVIVGPETGCGVDILNVQTVVSSNLFCATTSSTCNTQVATGSDLINMVVDRPDLAFTAFTGSLAPQPGGYNYAYNGEISNFGADLTGGTTTLVEFYCDTDNDGQYSPGDVLLGNYSTTLGITSTTPHPFSGGFFVPNTSCTPTNMIYALILPDTAAGYCICDTVFGNTNTVLPVDWLRAEGEALSAGNLISWEIIDLGQHDHFVVEKLVETEWEGVSSRISGSGQEFTWLDTDYLDREFYRIRQLDQNGEMSYSPLVEVVRSDELASVSLYPNPARDRVYIDHAEGAWIRVFNALGQEVVAVQIDTEQAVLDTETWEAGLYFFRFQLEGRQWTDKLIIE